MSDVHKVAPTRPFRRGRRARGAKIHPDRLAVDAFSQVRPHRPLTCSDWARHRLFKGKLSESPSIAARLVNTQTPSTERPASHSDPDAPTGLKIRHQASRSEEHTS